MVQIVQAARDRLPIAAVWAVVFVAILGVFSLGISLPTSAVNEYDCGTYSADDYNESCPGTTATGDETPVTSTSNNGSSPSKPSQGSPAVIVEDAIKSVGSCPWWIWLIIAILAAIVIWLIIVKRRKKKKEPSNA